VARGKSGCCSLLVDCYIADVGKMLINLTFIASLEKLCWVWAAICSTAAEEDLYVSRHI